MTRSENSLHNWGEQYDEWILRSDMHRLAEFGTKATEESDRQGKIRYPKQKQNGGGIVGAGDALFLYSLSLTHGSERLCALCLPVLSQQYERLDHTDLPLIRDDTIRCATQV